MHVQSGYKTVTPTQVACLVGAVQRGELSYRAVRVYFACLELVAIREAARRASGVRHKRPHDVPRYRVAEIGALTGLTVRAVRRELRALDVRGVLNYSESCIATRAADSELSTELIRSLAGRRSSRRPVPVPRPVIRFLAHNHKAVLGWVVIAYLVRGMSIDRATGEVRGVGSVKASWIAEVMQVSLRAAKAARGELIARRLISKDTDSVQRKLNRDGAYFRINLAWAVARPEGGPRACRGRGQTAAVVPSKGIAPLGRRSALPIAPPIKNKKTPYGSKDQRAWSGKPAGVFSSQDRERAPDLRNVRPEDILSFFRTEALYHQAVKARWVRDSSADFLNWVAAAVRAKTCRARDPVRVFVGIVRRALWHHVTDADEERARLAIIRYCQDSGGCAAPDRQSRHQEPDAPGGRAGMRACGNAWISPAGSPIRGYVPV